MTRYALGATCGAITLASTITLSAQAPAQPSPSARPQAPAPTEPAKVNKDAFTVTGCLSEAQAAGSTAPADATATPGSTRYMLKDAVANQPIGDRAGGTPPLHAPTSFVVVAATPDVNLGAHLNHMVRVTGTVKSDMAAGHMPEMPTTRAGEAPSAASAPMDMATADKKKSMTLMATAVTMISATCTPPSL